MRLLQYYTEVIKIQIQVSESKWSHFFYATTVCSCTSSAPLLTTLLPFFKREELQGVQRNILDLKGHTFEEWRAG